MRAKSQQHSIINKIIAIIIAYVSILIGSLSILQNIKIKTLRTIKSFMGSPLSSVADIVMQDFENIAIQKLSVHLTYVHLTYVYLFYRYVDDIILAASSESVDEILDTFNSLHIVDYSLL